MCSDYRKSMRKLYIYLYLGMIASCIFGVFFGVINFLIETTFYQSLMIFACGVAAIGYSIALYFCVKTNYASEMKTVGVVALLMLMDIIFKVVSMLTGQITLAEGLGNFGFLTLIAIITTERWINLKDRMLFLIRSEHEHHS